MGKRPKLLPLNSPDWMPLKDAVELRQRQTGDSDLADLNINAALKKGELRSLERRKDSDTPRRLGISDWKNLSVTTWPIHGIDHVVVHERAPGPDGDIETMVDDRAYFVWRPDFDGLYGASAARPQQKRRRKRVAGGGAKPSKPEATPSRPQSKTPKGQHGRNRSLTPEEIEKGIGIVHSQPKKRGKALRKALRDAGIDTSDSALYRLIIAPANKPVSK